MAGELLSRVLPEGTTITYAYDVAGRRVSETQDSTLTHAYEWVIIFPALFLGRQYSKKHPIRRFFFKGEGRFIPKTWSEVQEVVPGATTEAAIEYFATQPSMLEPPAGYDEFSSQKIDKL